MIVFQTEIEPVTGGSQMLAMSQVVNLTMFHWLIAAQLGQSILTEMYLVKRNQTSCLILLNRFDFAQKPEISESRTSYLTAASHRLAWAGAGESIRESILITITAIFLSLQRAMQMARSLISQ